MSGLSTHVLDTALGRPAAGVAVTLAIQKANSWQEVARAKTDADGRVAALLEDGALERGATYRLHFEVGTTFFPYVDVVFTVRDDRHHHVPLILSPFGYSTYRGS
ncbi:MAG: hydroxyisourate hydrolase [Gemmatimonadetes bacterium]|nr:MAG: hydroxyisourate hydrolase [Gemmatimonadota bacterium]PYO85225.1 MAG: hydroxyisourate hydrolase [Gemmatimonadota bacterium]PYP61510.1 MAG: hydroxyisourate hydrolase [Gemmatimonadota bacterium]